MPLEVFLNERFEQSAFLGIEPAVRDQHFAHGLARRAGPGSERGDQLVAGDQPVLQG